MFASSCGGEHNGSGGEQVNGECVMWHVACYIHGVASLSASCKTWGSGLQGLHLSDGSQSEEGAKGGEYEKAKWKSGWKEG